MNGNNNEAKNSDFCGARAGERRYAELPQEFDTRGSWRAGRPPDLFAREENGTGAEISDFCGARSGQRWIFELPRGNDARGSWRAGRPPDLPAREKTGPCCQLLRMRPFGPYIAGLRPATPQSPERLRSTPFDCVAIAPCCFAFRKAVLSHALAAMTALNKSAGQAVEICFAAMTALNKCAGQAGREALAAQDAYPVRKQTITEKLSVLTVPAQSKRPECAQFSGRYRFFKCLLSKCAQFSGRYPQNFGHYHRSKLRSIHTAQQFPHCPTAFIFRPFPLRKKSPLDPLSPWGWFALTY